MGSNSNEGIFVRNMNIEELYDDQRGSSSQNKNDIDNEKQFLRYWMTGSSNVHRTELAFPFINSDVLCKIF